MELQGAGVLITGASEGLGAALARALGRRGAKLALVARRKAELDEVVEAVRAEGGTAHALVEDVGDKTAVHRIAGVAQELLGRVDVLVHNAATVGPTPLTPLLDTECEDFERVLAVNLLGPFRLTKAVLGAALLRGEGLVLHLSSDAAVIPYPYWGIYSASKAALDQLSRVWAKETEALGARFVAVDPGEMDTTMYAQALPEADRAPLPKPRAVAERLAKLIEAAERIPSGSRLELSRWEAA